MKAESVMLGPCVVISSDKWIMYCKFGNFREDFIFAKRSFVKIKPSRNGKITLSYIDIGKSCLNREFFTSLMCLLMKFAKIKNLAKISESTVFK